MIENEEKITVKADNAKDNKTWAVDEEHIRGMSTYLYSSWQGRLLYMLMRFLMVIEGFLWSFLDIARRWRMRVSAKINRNYKSDR